MQYSSMDSHYFHMIDVWCYVETANGFVPGHVTAVPVLLNVGDLSVGWQKVFMIRECLEVLESK
jgi:hypothetical protein